MEEVHTLYLFGNGLSLAFNKNYYALPTITAAVQSRLKLLKGNLNASLLDDLQSISSAIDPKAKDVQTTSNFEDIAGPVDRLAQVLDLPELIAIAGLANDKAGQAISKVATAVRRTYYQVVGAVLEIVMRHEGENDSWSRVNDVADFVVEDAKQNGYADVYLLNYDAIFDSALLKTKVGVRLIDEFSGFDTNNVELFGGKKKRSVVAHALRDERWELYPAIFLNHLHGAGNWIATAMDIYKAKDLEELRKAGIYSRWTEGKPCSVTPAVVLGDQKERITKRWPFQGAYERLRSDVENADRVIIAGLSFRDGPLNRVLRSTLYPDTKVIAITPTLTKADIRKALDPKSRLKALNRIKGELPDALGDI